MRDRMKKSTFRIEPQTADERQALMRAIANFQSDWGYVKSFGLNELLNSWAESVGDVENGYRFSLPDYEISLSLRDEIEVIRRSVPPRLASEIEGAVRPIDDRFVAATKSVDSPILPPSDNQQLASWWFRLPTGVVPTEGDDSWLPLIREGKVEHLPRF